MKRTVVGYLRIAFGLSLLFLIATSIASFISIQSLLSSSNKVNHTHTVIRDLESVLSIVKDAESGQRAYLITGDVKYLKPFALAKERAFERLTKVRQLTEDNPEQQRSLDELQKVIQLKLEELENLIALRKVDKEDQQYALDIEKDLMDSATVLVKEMQLREYSLLEQHSASLHRFSSFSPVLILLVSICAFIMTYYFYNRVKNQIQVTDYLQREHELMLKKDEFLSIASHELKTPITNMKGYLQILQSICVKDGNLAYKNFITKANKQAEKLTSLVNDLLNVSKIQAGKLDYNFTSFKLSEIVEDVLDFGAQTSSTHKIHLRNIPDITIHADKGRIEQVLSNFISNAIKYSPEASEIIVDAKILHDQYLEVSVTDFGIGIPEEKISKIFSRFYRVEDKSFHSSGLGLGLYISDEIIKRHNGVVYVKSEPSKGSTFSFLIPLKSAEKMTA